MGMEEGEGGDFGFYFQGWVYTEVARSRVSESCPLSLAVYRRGYRITIRGGTSCRRQQLELVTLSCIAIEVPKSLGSG